jgi:4-hydroxy-4-methyl-2-oxoglutarate aldolase
MSEQKTAGLVERLSKIPYTGAISDILDEMGFHDQVLPQEIQSLHPGNIVAGKALTILGEPTDSEDPEVIFIPFLKMLGDVKLDDVLVNQPNDTVAAHLGELSSETAQYRGARGAVIDGGARDTDYILKLGFPVFARYKTPVDIVGRWRLVAHNVPIHIGRVHIEPGDYILGDRDGVLVIPQSIATDVVTKAEEVVHTENLVRKSVLRGMHPVEAFRQFGRF